MINIRSVSALSGIAVLYSGMALAAVPVVNDGWTALVPNPTVTPAYQTQAPLTGSISNTRHNLTQSFNPNADVMTTNARNNYGEVCVYCHAPHGANTKIKAPIWNRTINTGTYIIYDKMRTLNQPIGQPGANSLTCLSCHDGTIAIDSVINMPGSGRYNSNQEELATIGDKTWLNTWPNRLRDGTPTTSPALGHLEMGIATDDPSNPPIQTSQGNKCTTCHNTSDTGMPDFKGFVLGTDLRNEHAVGILFPVAAGPGIDFNQPTGVVVGKMRYFDITGPFNTNGRPDTNEPRLYETGDGPEVECASCHDPHGVPVNGPGTRFIPSFLRVSNGNAVAPFQGASSGLCLTCHDK